MSELAKQIYELCIQFELAEKDGRPTIELAQRITELRDRIATQCVILQPPAINREPDGDILFA